jgi:hypothetical protein
MAARSPAGAGVACGQSWQHSCGHLSRIKVRKVSGETVSNGYCRDEIMAEGGAQLRPELTGAELEVGQS